MVTYETFKGMVLANTPNITDEYTKSLVERLVVYADELIDLLETVNISGPVLPDLTNDSRGDGE